MDGLNEAARARIRANNVPDRLGADLERWTAFVVDVDEGPVVALGALDGGEIKRVYVDPAAQHRSAARSLLSVLEATARAHGIGIITLEASPSSVGFYESLGFVAGSEESLEVEHASFRFVHMAKDLGTIAPP